MRLKIYFFALIGIAFISSCKKADLGSLKTPSKTALSATDSADVYAVGYTYASTKFIQVAAYWKNGVIHKISDSTGNAYLEAVAAHDTDVIMAGTQEHPDNSAYTAFYYRNGQKVVLSDNAFVGMTQCIALSKCGCETYI